LLADDTHGAVWVAELDNELDSELGSELDSTAGRLIDGYAVITWGWSIEIGGLDVVLDEIYVRTRNRGTGARMLAALEAGCRARGVKRITLETELPNAAARRLYERHGYEADTSIWMAKELH
jgi:GNAT superfamily N-acetyltransferase